MVERYDALFIKRDVLAKIDELFTPWSIGRPETWVPSPDTKNLIALGYWLDDELKKVCVDDADRRTQLLKFNRLSRTYDIWETAAECINDVIDGTVEKNHKSHRRWG
jgi:hypothetical protein